MVAEGLTGLEPGGARGRPQILSLSYYQDDVEPIWATAAKNNVKFATFLWGRCDVPYDDVKRLNPEHCENYYSADLTKTLRINVDKALSKIQDGVDAAIVSLYFFLLLFFFCQASIFIARVI